jgi:hypothetical protein
MLRLSMHSYMHFFIVVYASLVLTADADAESWAFMVDG